jgi:hypothetical protein
VQLAHSVHPSTPSKRPRPLLNTPSLPPPNSPSPAQGQLLNHTPSFRRSILLHISHLSYHHNHSDTLVIFIHNIYKASMTNQLDARAWTNTFPLPRRQPHLHASTATTLQSRHMLFRVRITLCTASMLHQQQTSITMDSCRRSHWLPTSSPVIIGFESPKPLQQSTHDRSEYPNIVVA